MNSLLKACKPIDCTGKSCQHWWTSCFALLLRHVQMPTPKSRRAYILQGIRESGGMQGWGFYHDDHGDGCPKLLFDRHDGPISLMRHGQKCKKISCFHFWTIVVCFMQLFVSWIIKWILPGGRDWQAWDWEFRPGLNLRSIEERFSVQSGDTFLWIVWDYINDTSWISE